MSQGDILTALEVGCIDRCDLVASGSNYTFHVALSLDGGRQISAIYKPRQGEAPLYDFPPGTLYHREYAAYLVSQALGWDFVPPTVIRDGPHGIGVIQHYIDHEPGINYFNLRESHPDELFRMAVFDCLVCNADRKGGHCINGRDGKIWSIDHGLTFHHGRKMRTVMWDFCDHTIPGELTRDLQRLLEGFSRGDDLVERLAGVLSRREVDALRQRLELIINSSVIPMRELADPWRSVPWPLV